MAFGAHAGQARSSDFEERRIDHEMACALPSSAHTYAVRKTRPLGGEPHGKVWEVVEAGWIG